MSPKSKSIFASKTFWGAVIAALPAVLPAAGVNPGQVGQIAAAAGAALAIYGRATATQPVHVRKPKARP